MTFEPNTSVGYVEGGAPCDTCPSCCLETFTRTLTNGWGGSEFGGGDWLPTTDTYFSVDGDEGIIRCPSSVPFGQQTYITLPVTITVPFEFLILSRWERDGATPSLDGGWGLSRIILDTADGLFTPRPAQEPYAYVEWYYDDGTVNTHVPTAFTDGVNVSIRVVRPVGLPSTASREFDAGIGASGWPDGTVQNWVRWRVEHDVMEVKVWPFGSGEPGSWSASAALNTAPLDAQQMPAGFSRINASMNVGSAFFSAFVPGVQHFIDSICIVEGLICSGAGGTEISTVDVAEPIIGGAYVP